MATIHSRVAAAADLLRRSGVPGDDAGLEARLLAQHVLGWNAVRFLADARRADSPDFASRFDALIDRRSRREPLAYITGERDFWKLTFDVSPAVLIPRPETEHIVEAALVAFPDATAPIHVADVCTGSGCVGIAIAHERPLVSVIATDISDAALDVARRNVTRYALADRVRLLRADLLNGVEKGLDLIVANPPYVPAGDRETLAPEVRDYEPALALFADSDGLAVIRRLVAEAPTYLAPGGALIFEFGYGEAEAVADLIGTTPGLTMSRVVNDLQGIPRVAVSVHES
ncbi:MAG TPA: peptide chain release factor N(5)-glutamine methyltransferase [Vicinamibacterales bacterium]|nr:peptide chain release factor N(5)-glutamine methyltransferase [Vicinamibacterales bacterium]